MLTRYFSLPPLLTAITMVLLPAILFGQGKFTVNGRLKIEGGDVENSRVVVYKNGVKERTITSGLNKFTLDLDINQTYVMAFEKDGFVAKKISFNTKAPSEAIPNGFTPFDFAVSLFKQYDDINLVVFNQPVGIIHYDNKLGDFDYDTDYTKSIQSQLQEVLEKVEQKQKEEEVKAKEDQEKMAEAAKAAAKAEAQAKKDAEALAKAEEKKKEEARKEEEKRLAEQRKAEKLEIEQNKMNEPEPKIAQRPLEKPKEEPKPDPKPDPVPDPPPVAEVKVPARVHRPSIASKPTSGEDGRRSVEMRMAEEASPVTLAIVQVKEETRVDEPEEEPEIVRDEEQLVEPTRITTVVKLTMGEHVDEFRKVFHKWGGLYYFKNGAACSKLEYEVATLQNDDLAGATPSRPR